MEYYVQAQIQRERPFSGYGGLRVSSNSDAAGGGRRRTSVSSPMLDNWQLHHHAAPSSDALEETMWQMTIQPQDSQEGMDSLSGSYPERPGEPDCVYYMRTGLCGYGMHCHFNHPPNIKQAVQYKGVLPERIGQPECQYFLKTGTCKFGATCKYHHPRDRDGSGGQAQLNFLGLPMRQGEKDCAYYMRTGSCKYGVTCKFHHPQPAAVGTLLPVSGPPIYATAGSSLAASSAGPYPAGMTSWPLPRTHFVSSPRLQGPPTYMPAVIVSPQQGMVSVPTGWSTYQGPVSPLPSPEGQQQLGTGIVYSSTHSTDSSSSGRVRGVLNPFLQGSAASVGHATVQSQINVPHRDTFPERPDQPECQYYMKTGDCKFGATCRFHHPKDRVAQSPTCVLSPIGLPLRPGQPACTFYSRYGICKFGPTCKFDHPLTGVNYGPAALSFSEMSVAPYPRGGPPTGALVRSTSETSQEVSKSADQPSSSEALTSFKSHSTAESLGSVLAANASATSAVAISSDSVQDYPG